MSQANTIDIEPLLHKDEVHRKVYTDPDIFDLEMERLWHRTWIYVGHESQVKNPGDYFATTIGRQPVILVRHKDDKIHVLYNRCAHKGAQLVGDTSGCVKAFRCCYHGWRFDTDGALLTIPLEGGYDNTGFCRDNPDTNVKKVPRYDSYRGFVFASLSAKGPDLKTWLGGVASSIDNMVDRSPDGELEVTGGVLRYTHDSNWKFFVENLNDLMHAIVTHQSSSQTARIVAKRVMDEKDEVPWAVEIFSPFTNRYSFFEEMGLHAFEYGHSYSGGKVSIHSAYSDIPGYVEALESAYGKEKTLDIFSENRHNTVFYPSATIKGPIQTMRVVKPLAVDKTVIESWTFRLKGAPEAMTQRSILYCTLINSSANLVGPDDYESYHRLQYGLQSEANDWVSMHRHMDQEIVNADGTIEAEGTNDIVFRNQFKAWKQYMSAEDA